MKSHHCGPLVLVLSVAIVAQAYAGGAFQRTDDRKKTLVWNNDPQSGDAATWSGARDSEGYATGPGTLTWSRMDRGFSTGSNLFTTRKRTPISTYSGTMEHGKFNGGVMTVDRGKTYHATFVDGQRKGNWATGPLITKAQSAEPAPAVEKPERGEAAKPVASKVEGSTIAETATATKVSEKTSEASKPVEIAKETTEDVPAAGPEEQKADVGVQKSETTAEKKTETTQKTPLIAQASTGEADQSATPRQQAVNRKAALAPGAVRAIEKPNAPVAKKTETESVKKATKVAEEKTEKPTKTAKTSPSPSPETKAQIAEETEEAPAEGPTHAAKQEIPPPHALHSSSPAAKETPVDDSIRTLTGPPSGLKNKPTTPEAATSPPAKTPEPVAASSPPAASPPPQPAAAAKLTAVNAMDIADIEARTRGFDLGEYQLPKAEYSAANDAWSVSYEGRDSEGATKKFSVIVQDKSGKAEVKK